MAIILNSELTTRIATSTLAHTTVTFDQRIFPTGFQSGLKLLQIHLIAYKKRWVTATRQKLSVLPAINYLERLIFYRPVNCIEWAIRLCLFSHTSVGGCLSPDPAASLSNVP